MGNWYDDIDYALEEIIRTKLSQVIDELKEEFYLNIDTKNDVYHYFKNSKKTGIIDRAEKYLGLRFDELQAINEKEKSDALSLAKYLYLVEINYPLLKVMSNPSLAQTTIYGEKSGNEDEDIVAIIAEKIKTKTTPGFADRSDSCYYEMLNDWLYIRSELTNCIIDSYFSLNQLDDNCYEIPQELAYAAAELLEKSKAKKTKEQKEFAIEISEAVKSNRLKTDHHSSQKTYLSVIIEYLETEFEYIVQNIDRGQIADLPYNYGVFDTFYTCFCRYYVSRCFSDIPNEENAGIKASLEVENFFSQYADSAILFSHLEVVEKLLSGRSSKAEFEQLYFLEKMKDMIQEGVPVELKDADMRFALKHLKTVAEWWMPDKLDDNYINVTIIPVVDQADGFSINTKYTAVIKKIDCFKDKAHPDDVTIRVSAYLYNGGTTEKYCKYFNCVHSKGKEEFDEFCKLFDSINETGKIDTDKIIGRLCEAELSARKIKFITTLIPKGSPNAAIMEQYDDIIRMCTLISNDRKEYNQLDFDAFFKSYVVNDTSDNWKNYPACLTDAKIYRSKGIEGDFNLKIKVNVILKNELKSANQIYKNVLTTGRRAFQEFAEEFELWDKDEEGIRYIDLSKLDNKYCAANVNTANQLKGIFNVTIGSSDKEKKVIDFFEKHIKAAHNINLATVPDEVMYYQYIPVTTSEDEYMPNIEYHGCIRDFDCEEVGDDINVKIAAYVFDGGKTRVIAKFFNSIKTNGKSEFDRFCKMYDIVDNEGRIQIEKIKGRFSKVVLWENRKGNKYIDSLEPLPVEYDVHNNQYKMLIKEYLNSHKTKKKD